MSNRLDQEREAKLQPERMKVAIDSLEKMGYSVEQRGETTLVFTYKGHQVNFFPYSGWHSGKTIKDGRGLKNLLAQLKYPPPHFRYIKGGEGSSLKSW